MFHEHFGIEKIVLEKVAPKDQMAAMQFFISEGGSPDREFSFINVLFYIDNCGERFMDMQRELHEKIAKAMFDKLSNRDKVQVYEYIEWVEENPKTENIQISKRKN